jgi:hypothetical protein
VRVAANLHEKNENAEYIQGSLRHRLELEVTLSSPIVIHVLRPYANEEEYLANESFSIDSKTMLLIDQAQLPADTAVVFDVQLQNGQKPIRAEAKVLGYVPAANGRPSGLRVRFKRFGAATKAFIDRAVAASAGAAPVSAPGAAPPSRPISVRAAPALGAEPAAPRAEAAQAAASVPPKVAPVGERRESSGIHRRAVAMPATPVNREELLERLRTRARAVVRSSESKPGEQTG